MIRSWLRNLLLSLLVVSPASAFNRGVMEGIPATNNTVWVDTTNVSLGIGTSSAPYKATIGNSISGVDVDYPGVFPNAGAFRFGDSTGWKLGFGRARNALGGPYNYNGTSMLLTLQDNGFFGIGTTAPSSLEEVANGILTVSGVSGGINVSGTQGVAVGVGGIKYNDGTVQTSSSITPAGGSNNYLQNTSSLQSGATGYISSMTVTTSFSLPYLTAGLCTTPDATGKLTSTACGSGGGGGASTLAVTAGVSRSSPTTDILFNPNQMSGSITASSITISVLTSSLTAQGNAFNGNSQLVQTTAAGKYPAIDGSLITNLPSGVSVYPATSTVNAAQGITGSTFTFNGPAQSTVTFGVSVGSLTVTGSGGGLMTMTEGSAPLGVVSNDLLYADSSDHAFKAILNNATTAAVLISTTQVTVGQCAYWTATGEQGSVPCASGGPTLSGNNIWTGWENWNSPSVSTFTYGVYAGSVTTSLIQVSDYQTQLLGNTTALVNVYSQFNFNKLATLGSKNQPDQFYVKDQSPTFGQYGANFGGLFMGLAGTPVYRVYSSQDPNNYLELWNASGFDTLSTGASGRAILLSPNTTEVARAVDTGGLIVSSSETVKGRLGVSSASSDPYEFNSSTTSTWYHIQISTSGHFLTGGSTPTVSSCGSTPNGSVVGNDHDGVITIGGGSVTACTLTFANTYGAGCVVSCHISENITTATPDVTATATTMTLGFSASIGGGQVAYDCVGVNSLCH